MTTPCRHDTVLMRQDDILEECLEIHRQLLQVQQDMHRWFSRVSGVEVAS